MRRVVAVSGSLACLCVLLAAGFGGSWLEAVAHQKAKHFGDPHAVITKIETVRLSGARRGHQRWAMVQLKSHHDFRVGCIRPGPGLARSCRARYLEVGVDLSNHVAGLVWGMTQSQVSAVTTARRARRQFRIFPDTAGLYLSCAIPRRGSPSGRTLKGTCSTVVAPSATVRKVKFVESWGRSQQAGWVVTLGRSGRVRSIRVTGHPPQLRK
jgi:hypothetical protein